MSIIELTAIRGSFVFGCVKQGKSFGVMSISGFGLIEKKPFGSEISKKEQELQRIHFEMGSFGIKMVSTLPSKQLSFVGEEAWTRKQLGVGMSTAKDLQQRKGYTPFKQYSFLRCTTPFEVNHTFFYDKTIDGERKGTTKFRRCNLQNPSKQQPWNLDLGKNICVCFLI